MANLESILSYTIFGNDVKSYLLALAIFLSSVIILRIFKYFVLARAKSLSKRTKTDLDDFIISLIDNLGWIFYIYLSFYLSTIYLNLNDVISSILQFTFFVFVTYYLIKVIEKVVDYFIRKNSSDKKNTDHSLANLITTLLKIVLWVLAIILFVDNRGYDVSTLLTGLGIGGIAIAFALQSILSDIFSSFSIYFDKPFKPGDFVVIGSDKGFIKKVGIKSTRIQTLEGQELVVSNKELTESRINNYGTMSRRRVVLTIALTYDTSYDKLIKAKEILRNIITSHSDLTLDRVHFFKIDKYCFDFEAVYYVESPDYLVYMDLREKINLELIKEFEREGIRFAYPTQTIVIDK